jgi:hypothetical protein
MNHQPYEKWIFEKEELDLEQAKRLQIHLKLCDRCDSLASALAHVDTQFESTELVSPDPGFTDRWFTRLQIRRQKSQQRQNAVLLSSLSLGTLVLAVPLVIRFFLAATSPGNVVSGFIQDFVNWMAIIGFTGDVTAGVLDGMVDTIPLVWWFSAVIVLIGLCSTWIVVMHRVRPRAKALNGVKVDR